MTESTIAFGVILGLGAGVLNAIGLILQKKSHMKNQLLPAEAQKPYLLRASWIVGFSIYVIGNICNAVAVTFAPQSLISSLTSISLATNTILAPWLLGEKLFPFDIVATVLIIGGTAVIVVFGSRSNNTRSLDELISLYGQTEFISYATVAMCILFVLVFSANVVQKKLNILAAELQQQSPNRASSSLSLNLNNFNSSLQSSSAPVSPSGRLVLSSREATTRSHPHSSSLNVVLGSRTAGEPITPDGSSIDFPRSSDTPSAPQIELEQSKCFPLSEGLQPPSPSSSPPISDSCAAIQSQVNISSSAFAESAQSDMTFSQSHIGSNSHSSTWLSVPRSSSVFPATPAPTRSNSRASDYDFSLPPPVAASPLKPPVPPPTPDTPRLPSWHNEGSQSGLIAAPETIAATPSPRAFPPPSSGLDLAYNSNGHTLSARGSSSLRPSLTIEPPRQLIKLRQFLALAYAAIAGALSSINILMTKSCGEVISKSFSGDSSQLTNPIFYLFLGILIISNSSEIHYMQRALQKFDALIVAPMFQTTFVILSILTGSIYFQEIYSFEVQQWILFPIGVAITLCGVLLLSQRDLKLFQVHQKLREMSEAMRTIVNLESLHAWAAETGQRIQDGIYEATHQLALFRDNMFGFNNHLSTGASSSSSLQQDRSAIAADQVISSVSATPAQGSLPLLAPSRHHHAFTPGPPANLLSELASCGHPSDVENFPSSPMYVFNVSNAEVVSTPGTVDLADEADEESVKAGSR